MLQWHNAMVMYVVSLGYLFVGIVPGDARSLIQYLQWGVHCTEVAK